MSVTVTQQLTQQTVFVTGNPVENNVVVTVSNARGPEGPEGPSGASTWDDIGGTASSIPFEPVTPPAYAEGLVFYDTDDKSLTYYNDEADVSMNLGREMWVRVRNDSGATIANGKVVYINDAQGQLPTIRLARADAEATSRVIGIATHDIENNSDGYVTTSGMVKGLNTSAFQDGDLLFLSAATAGEMTTTAPTAPNRAVQVAIVAHAHVSQGKLYCHPENDSVASTGIVDSTATGRAILTAANQAAARSTGLGSGATGDALFTAASVKVANEALDRITKIRTSDATGRTNNTFAADNQLTGFQLEANTVYRAEVRLRYTTGGGFGIKFQFSTPSLRYSSGDWGSGILAFPAATAQFQGVYNSGSNIIFGNSAFNVTGGYATGFFEFETGSTAGNAELQWAQNTTGATPTVLLTGSTITLIKRTP